MSSFSAFFGRGSRFASRFIQENPMKVYSLIFISGDLFMGMNVLYGASALWLCGAALGIMAHSNKLLHGKGAPDIDGDDFNISLDDAINVLVRTVQYSLGILTRSYWKRLLHALSQVRWHFIWAKMRRCIHFRKYPLDFGWALIFVAGVLYFIDGLNVAGFRDNGGAWEALLGASVFTGAGIAFVTDSNKLAGRVFALATLCTIISGILNLNMAFLCTSCIFLYGNYLVGKVDSKYQSKYMDV